MIPSRTSKQFWDDFRRSPVSIQRAVRKAYQLWRQNPRHPSLRFKPVGPYWSVRIGRGSRVLGVYKGDMIVWFFIDTSHDNYARLISGKD